MEGQTIPHLQSKRLDIYLPEPSQAPLVADFLSRNHQHLTRFNETPPKKVYEAEYWTKKLEKQRYEAATGSDYRFFISPKDKAEIVIGSCSLTQLVRGSFQACYLGYEIAKDYEGRGYMREAVEQAIHFAFVDLKLHRLMADYMPENSRSGRLLKGLGFEVVGYARDYIYVNGQWQDHVLTALNNHQLPHPVI